MRRSSTGMQDVLANQMNMAGPYGGMGQGMGRVGDTMARLSQNIEQMNQAMQRSPLVSGHPLFRGAGMSGGQMVAGYFGAPIQVQGLPAGAAGSISQMMISDNLQLAMENLGRGTLTELLPGVIGAAASLMPGGAVLGPMAGAAARFMAPGVLRATGLDASLAHGEFARNFRSAIGDRLAGGSVSGRFAESYGVSHDLARHMTGFVREQQEQFNIHGVMNFGLGAEDYMPLQQGMLATMTQRDLNRLVSDGGNVIREQMTALMEVSSTLNMTFEETAQFAQQFGEVEGGAASLAQYARTIEDAAQRAGGGIRRGLAAQFGLAVRAQARHLGLQGEVTRDMAVQDVGVLQGLLNTEAGQRLLTMDRMAAFGGDTEQERIQNMVASMFGAGAAAAQGPIGGMIRANLLAGRGLGQAAFGGSLTDFMSGAGAQFANDPFGFVISGADPMVNQQVQQSALFGTIHRMQQAFGSLDPRAAQAAFISQAERFGMSEVQAGAVWNFYSANLAAAEGLAGDGRTASDIMGLATNLSSKLGITTAEAMARMSSGDLSVQQAEFLSQGIFGATAPDTGERMTQAEMERRARAAATRLSNERIVGAAADYNAARDANIASKGFLGSVMTFGSRAYHQARLEWEGARGMTTEERVVYAAELSKLQASQAGFGLSSVEQQYIQAHRHSLGRFGVDVTDGGADFGGFHGAGAFSESFAGIVRELAGGEGALNFEGLSSQEKAALLQTVNAWISGGGADIAQDLGFEGTVTNVESENFGQLLRRLTKQRGGNPAALALNALRHMFNETTAITGAMNRQVELLKEIADNTAAASKN